MQSRSSCGAALAFVLAAAVGCSGSQSEPGTVEVLTWWTEHGERDALDGPIGIFERRFPGQQVTVTETDGSLGARTMTRERVLEGFPPETFQANGGWDLMAWVAYNNNNGARESKLEELDSNAPWVQHVPIPVLDTVRFEGKVYGVPLNIHRLNVLFFNKRVFEDYGLPAPTTEALSTPDALFALCDALIAKGMPVPIALAADDTSWLTLYLFENLLVARAGGPYYTNFFQGDINRERILDSPYLQDAIRDLGELLSYDTAARTRSWSGAVNAMLRGDVAMTIMGDWAKGYIVDQQQQVDFGAIPMPGTADTFVFTTDTFGLPKGARNRSGALGLLEVFASPEGQEVFNLVKGSIPARSDADASKFDPFSQAAIEDFREAAENSASLVPATSIMAPPDYLQPVYGLLADYAGFNPERADRAGNVSVVLHGLANRADMLRDGAWRY